MDRHGGVGLFVALETIGERRRGVTGAVRGFLARITQRPAIELRQAGDAQYLALRVSLESDIDWAAIQQLAGRYAKAMLLPDTLQPPEDCGIARLHPERYENAVLLHTACDMVTRSRMQLYRRVLGFVDANGEHADMLGELLKYYSSVHVFTFREEYYFSVSANIMEQLGAPVIIVDTLRALDHCAVTVVADAPPELALSEFAMLRCPVVYAAAAGVIRGSSTVTALRPSPPEWVQESCPAGIDAAEFAAALYERCDVTTLPLQASTALLDGQSAAMGDIIDAVMK